jgi:hypothetical protein
MVKGRAADQQRQEFTDRRGAEHIPQTADQQINLRQRGGREQYRQLGHQPLHGSVLVNAHRLALSRVGRRNVGWRVPRIRIGCRYRRVTTSGGRRDRSPITELAGGAKPGHPGPNRCDAAKGWASIPPRGCWNRLMTATGHRASCRQIAAIEPALVVPPAPCSGAPNTSRPARADREISTAAGSPGWLVGLIEGEALMAASATHTSRESSPDDLALASSAAGDGPAVGWKAWTASMTAPVLIASPHAHLNAAVAASDPSTPTTIKSCALMCCCLLRAGRACT